MQPGTHNMSDNFGQRVVVTLGKRWCIVKQFYLQIPIVRLMDCFTWTDNNNFDSYILYFK